MGSIAKYSWYRPGKCHYINIRNRRHEALHIGISSCEFFGLLPSESSSDETIVVKGINPRCNQYLRTMLIEAAWVAIRCSPSLLFYYKQHSAYNNNNKKAIIKVARKLAMIIRAVWLSQKPFEEGYQSAGQSKTIDKN